MRLSFFYIAVLMCAVLAFGIMPVESFAYDCTGEIYLDMHGDVSGILVLDVIFEPSHVGLCGLELDITYSSEVLMLSSCERGEGLGELYFDCSLRDGRVRILLWGTGNSSAGGRVATVGFIPLCAEDECIDVLLSLPTNSSAVYLCGNEIYSADLSLCGMSITLKELYGNGESGSGTEGYTESGTECTFERVTEVITEDVMECVTEGISESDIEQCSESCSEEYSESVGGSGKDIGRRCRNLCFGMLAVPSVLSVGVMLPLGFCKGTRRRYF